MLNFNLYAIYTENNERNGSIKELFTSFDEAKENRFKYGNWCCPKGYVWIYHYNAYNTFIPSHRWLLNENGDIILEFDWC